MRAAASLIDELLVDRYLYVLNLADFECAQIYFEAELFFKKSFVLSKLTVNLLLKFSFCFFFLFPHPFFGCHVCLAATCIKLTCIHNGQLLF